MIKKTLRIFLKSILGLVLFIGIYFLFAMGLSRISVNNDANDTPYVDIYILTNGVHTDIVVPAKHELIDWTSEMKFNHTRENDTTAKYLAIGWGDKGFYLETPTWADLKPSTAVKAAFGLSSTAMHTTYYKTMNESETCRKISINTANYQKLIDYITASFEVSETANFQLIDTEVRYGKTDAFYEAKGSYSLFKTCNTWANSALKSCNQKACLWTPFDKGIFALYE